MVNEETIIQDSIRQRVAQAQKWCDETSNEVSRIEHKIRRLKYLLLIAQKHYHDDRERLNKVEQEEVVMT